MEISALIFRFQLRSKRSRGLSQKASSIDLAYYTHGLALAGLASLSKERERDTVFIKARDAYQKAFDMCKAAGVVADAMSLLQEVPGEVELTSLVFPYDSKLSKISFAEVLRARVPIFMTFHLPFITRVRTKIRQTGG